MGSDVGAEGRRDDESKYQQCIEGLRVADPKDIPGIIQQRFNLKEDPSFKLSVVKRGPPLPVGDIVDTGAQLIGHTDWWKSLS